MSIPHTDIDHDIFRTWEALVILLIDQIANLPQDEQPAYLVILTRVHAMLGRKIAEIEHKNAQARLLDFHTDIEW